MKPKILSDKTAKKKIEAITGIHPLVAEILYNRGYKTQHEMEDFLQDHPLNDPFSIKDIEKGAEIIKDAINNKEKIVAYVDTDADGICSAGILVPTLRDLGADVEYYTNNKLRDGYGMCKLGVDNILAKWPDTKTIITADNGIVAYDAIDYAKNMGLKVVVTDHHEPGNVSPNADAVINPKQPDCEYPFKEICGTTVAWKLMYVVIEKMREKLPGNMAAEVQCSLDKKVELVALASIADVTPLVNENRTIVKNGIAIMNNDPSLAIRTFKKMLGVDMVDAVNTLAFRIAPHLNSPSRMNGDPSVAINLLLTDNEANAEAFVAALMRQNEERKALTEKNTQLALGKMPKDLPYVIVIQDESINVGVAGIVAGHITEKYNRPAIVLGEDFEGFCVGSARSVDGFNIKEALDEVSDLLYKYGGHAKAAGMTFSESKLEEFKRRINEIAERVLDADTLRPTIRIDALAENEDLDMAAAEAIEAIGPFGEGWPEPVIGLTFEYNESYYMGKMKEHLKLVDRNTGLSIVGWGLTSKFNRSEKDFNKAIGTIGINEYKGRRTTQFFIKDDMLY
jgi:single-stranded-DNA-specific exonuclease